MQVMSETQAGPKRRMLEQRQDLVSEVAKGTISGQVLERKLHEHVESVDADMVCPSPLCSTAWHMQLSP